MEKKQVKQILHFPMHTLRAEKCNDKGQIENWFYHSDWTKKKPSEVLKKIPAFGFGNGNEVELYILHPYISGFDYYSPIDYSGSLPYALLEETIADYQINDCQNGFSGTKIINFNNGVGTEEMREKTKREVLGKLTGAKGEKVIIAFNANADSRTTVEDLPLTDAPAHYEYLSKECFDKLIVGHRVTSPMLLGIRTGDGGLGNNADEIKTATLLMDNIVIKPYQLEIIDALDEILAINKISLKLYFKTIQPLEFVDTEGMNTETKEEETGVKMSSHLDTIDLDSFGEEIDLNEWELVDSRKVDYDTELELDAELELLNNPKKSILSKVYNFVSTGTARPKSNSEQDSEKYITRYKYSGNPTPERDFCKKMINAKKLYRKEDIIAMGEMPVNKGFGLDGADTYSIWLWKGGGLLSETFPNGTCKHFWTREMYRKIGSGKNTAAQPSTPSDVRKNGEIAPTNDSRVYQAPHDMK